MIDHTFKIQFNLSYLELFEEYTSLTGHNHYVLRLFQTQNGN